VKREELRLKNKEQTKSNVNYRMKLLE